MCVCVCGYMECVMSLGGEMLLFVPVPVGQPCSAANGPLLQDNGWFSGKTHVNKNTSQSEGAG